MFERTQQGGGVRVGVFDSFAGAADDAESYVRGEKNVSARIEC